MLKLAFKIMVAIINSLFVTIVLSVTQFLLQLSLCLLFFFFTTDLPGQLDNTGFLFSFQYGIKPYDFAFCLILGYTTTLPELLKLCSVEYPDGSMSEQVESVCYETVVAYCKV
jgi:hypothetical protein